MASCFPSPSSFGICLVLRTLVVFTVITTAGFLSPFQVFCQGVGINSTGAAPDNSAILDVSSTTQGLISPRMTTAERDAITSPVAGLYIYNTDCNNFNFYTGTAWLPVNSGGGNIPGTSGTISGTANVCQSQTGVAYSITAVTGATSYVWSYTGVGFSITAGGNSNSITADFSASATAGNLTVSAANACGSGTVSPAYAITIGGVPSAAGTITGTNTVCQGNLGIAYSITAIPDATGGYAWTYTGTGLTIASGSGTNAITANFSGSATSGTLTVVGLNSCGSGPASPGYGITVYSGVPAAPGSISGDPSVCAGDNGVAYSVPSITDATGYNWSYGGTGWSIASGANTNSITADFTTSATSGSLVVNGTNVCGSGPNSAGFAITLSAPPATAGTITGTALVCEAQSGVAYSVGAVTNATGYTWSYTGSGFSIATGSNTNSITANFAVGATSGNLTVTGTNAACGSGGTSPAFSITVSPAVPDPAGTITTGTASLCQGALGVAYSLPAPITNAEGYTWSYTGIGFTIASGSNTESITANFSATATSGNLTVFAFNGCGNGTVSAAYPILVLTKPDAAGAIGGPTPVCKGDVSKAYSVGTITGATGYTWAYSGAGFTITGGSNTENITADFSAGATTGNLTVYGTNVCGNGTTSSGYSITVNGVPNAAGTISGPTAVCEGDNGVAYSVAVISGATGGYTWSYSGTGFSIATGSNTKDITANFAAGATSGNLTVFGYNVCGNGPTSPAYSISIDVTIASAGPITGTTPVCQGQGGVAYSITAIPSATGYNWNYTGTGFSIVSGANTEAITANFSAVALTGNLTVSGTNTCGNGGSSPLFNVVVDPLPAVPTATAGTGATQIQITANWGAAANATKYYLDVSTVSTFATYVSGYQDLDVGNVTTYSVTGLVCGQTYFYRVRSNNSCGTSGNSNTITYATLAC